MTALGILGLTMVIQLFVFPDGWPDHILWIAPLVQIIARGPGVVSLDQLIYNRLMPVPLVAR